MVCAINLVGLRVRCYRNLNNGLLSVQHKGRVVAHVESLTLAAATFQVQPAGRARVLARNEKEVHAFVTGTVTEGITELPTRASYNPRRYATFTLSDGTALLSAPMATLRDGAVFIQ